MIRKENFALPTVLREYYTYLVHDIDVHQRGGKVRKTNKYPYKLLCTICACVVRGHDGIRRGVYNHLKQEHGIHIHTVSTDETEVGAVRHVAVEKTFSRRHAIQLRFDTTFFRYVITSGTPFKMLTNHHLHDSLRSLQPGVRPMSVKYLRKQLRIVNNMKVVPYIRWLIQNVKDATVLLDCWSTRRIDSVLAIQDAYLNADFKMITKTVSVLRLLGRHTAQNIRTVGLKEFGKYNLGPKVRFVVTDAGSNMRKVFGADFEAEGSLVNYVQGFCLAHKLHRVVTNAIKSIPLVESHRARLVSQITYIRRSSLLNDQFQVLAGGVTLKRPVVTRWNSYFDALKQFTTSVFTAVGEVIGDTHLECNYVRAPAPLRFDPSELNELRDILRALESLSAVTDDLHSDALVATEAIPKINGVYKILYNMTMVGPLNEFVSSLKTQLVQFFEHIFKTEVLLFMALLNPAFRHLFFDAYLRRLPLNPFNLPSSDDVLEMFVRKYPKVDDVFTVEQPSTPTAGVTGRKITAMWEERITDIENERHFTSHNEITKYSNFYDAARVVFTCVISTASVERCFSILGHWLASRRNNMHIATFCMLLQVRGNIEPSDTTVRAWQQLVRSEFASSCGADESHSSKVCSTSSDSDGDSSNENCENQCIQQPFSVVQDCVSEGLGEEIVTRD
ncbi:unnamed protein product [Allacma fusca]|uniref:HAT C-terminal dimerisation domain-containing protein n=1 Tax=Allacma fusca TaxID=39272 RepID=A0A8J2JKY2_9HEXA|nr:unnamed protein product [Allacma fusca]